MIEHPRIIAFAGSVRRESFNRKLLRVAAEGAVEAGAEVTLIDLADYPMPLYDGDLEAAEGLPENARRLKAVFREADGFLVASPEYNSSVTPLLKNTIDWLSRAEADDEPSLVAFRGKVAGLISASPGRLGGLRGLVHLRAILGNIGVHVIPAQRAVGGVSSAFDDSGAMTQERDARGVRDVARQLAETARRLMG